MVNKFVLMAFWPPTRQPNLPLREQLHENTANAFFTTISTISSNGSAYPFGRATPLWALPQHSATTAVTRDEKAVPRHNQVHTHAFYPCLLTTISTNSSIPGKTARRADGLHAQLRKLFQRYTTWCADRITRSLRLQPESFPFGRGRQRKSRNLILHRGSKIHAAGSPRCARPALMVYGLHTLGRTKTR